MTTPAEAGALSSVLSLGLACAAGVGLWRSVVTPRLPVRAEPRTVSPAVLLPFLAGFFVYQLALGVGLSLIDLEHARHADQLALQTAANLAGLVAVLVLSSLSPESRRILGLPLRRPLLALVAAISAWLAFLPILALVNQLNLAAFRWLGIEAGVQDHLRRFVDEGGASSPWAWASMAVIIPVCEEVLFRGALYGALRRMVSPAGAMVVSALAFGVAHDPAVIVPVASLGWLFAWVYERTGSLAAPCLLHMLNNSYTLSLAAFFPDLFQ